jgi:hypothetical protein
LRASLQHGQREALGRLLDRSSADIIYMQAVAEQGL